MQDALCVLVVKTGANQKKCESFSRFSITTKAQKIFRVDIIACLDACFKQKCRKAQGKEPPVPRQHPDTAFISPDDVKGMEALVDEARTVKDPKKSKHKAPAESESSDQCETGIKVPNSILNLCGDSFKAADDKRVKASTQYFSDTGLMALLCRHDRVLWLANMTSAGEKQTML